MTNFIRHYYLYFIVIVVSSFLSFGTLIFQSIRLDEAQSLWVATKSVHEILHLDAQDVLVPLYELILHFWLQVFGATIIAARSLSFLFFLITLPFLYFLGKEASSQKVGIIAVTLFSLSPFIMWYSSEARMYTLFAFVITLNHLFFVKFLHSFGSNGKFGYLVTAVLGLYTHYFFIFLLLTQGIFLTTRLYLRKDIVSKKLFIMFFFLLVATGICFLPWAMYFISLGAASNTQPLIRPPTTYNLLQAIINFMFGFQSNTVQSFIISLWPIAVLSLFLIFTKNEKDDVLSINYFVVATFLPIILVFLISFVRPIFLTRYLILVTPTLFFLLAWMLSSYQRRGYYVFLNILLLCMFAFLVYQNISTTTPVKENYQGVAAFLQQNATPSDIIIVSAPFTVYPLEYTYQGNAKIVTLPLWDRFTTGAIPSYSHTSMVQQIDSYQSQYVHMFVVLSYDQGYEGDIKKYLDTHYQRNTLKTFSSGLEVREYQLRYGLSTQALEDTILN